MPRVSHLGSRMLGFKARIIGFGGLRFRCTNLHCLDAGAFGAKMVDGWLDKCTSGG